MGTVIYMICRPPDLDNFVDARIRKHEAEREKELGTRIERNTEEGEEVERIVEDDAILPAATAAAGAAEATMPRRRERAWGFADLVWARRD